MDTKICSKCGRELPLSEYHKNGFKPSGEQKYRGYCKQCANELEKKRYRQKKAFINNNKRMCKKCGDTRVYVLEFHHIDPSKKDFTIGRVKKGSFEVIQKEIDKCIVLCANCHREFHYLADYENITLEDYLFL